MANGPKGPDPPDAVSLTPLGRGANPNARQPLLSLQPPTLSFMLKLLFLDRLTDATRLTDACKVDLLQRLRVGALDEDAVYARRPAGRPSLLLVTSGIARVFIDTHDGRDVTQHFLRAEDFVVADLADERGVVERVEAITELGFVSIDYAELEALALKHPCLIEFLAAFYTARDLRERERAARFRQSGAVETYASFLLTHPGLETQVPTIHLASYLGLTTSQFMRARQKYRQRGIM